MPNNLDWLDEIEWEDLLNSDMRLIKDKLGEQVLKELLIELKSIHLYVTDKPINEARKRYVDRFYNGRNAKELAIKLAVSEQFIYKTNKENINRRREESRQKNLFS